MSAGQFATARRGFDSSDVAYIAARPSIPHAALARMMGRSLADIQGVTGTMRQAPREEFEPEPPTPNYAGQEVLSLYKGLIQIPPDATTMLKITEEVAARHGVTVRALRGTARARKFAWPRQEAMSLCRDAGLWSYPQIGQFFGGRDHTTAMWAEKRHKARQGEAAE